MIRLSTKIILLPLMFLAVPPASADEVDARLDWVRRVALGTAVSGVIAEVSVRPGQSVTAGQSLVKLDASVFSARTEAAKAKVAALTPAHDEARKERERAQELYERMLLSDHELAEAAIKFGRADAEYKHARAELAQVEQDLKSSDIRAPFDGIVLSCAAEVGATVVSALSPAPLVELAESGRMVAVTWVDANQLARLTLGDKAHVTSGGRAYAGVVYALAAEPKPGLKDKLAYEVRVAFDTASARPPAGLAAKINLP